MRNRELRTGKGMNNRILYLRGESFIKSENLERQELEKAKNFVKPAHKKNLEMGDRKQ